jgi:uncharacterized protein (TIGR00255 family)
MALSMTGCGEGIATDGPSTCRVELRTVNNRFFKFSLRGRDGFATLEPRIETIVRGRVRRGTVQMTLDLGGPAAPGLRRLDRLQLEAYLEDLENFCATHGIPAPQSVDGLLPLPGILVDAMPTPEALERLWSLVGRALDQALDRLDAMRHTEGAALAREMRSMCAAIRGLGATIESRVPAAVEEHRIRLQERVGKLLHAQGLPLAPADLAREVAILADRSDIAEELVRLASHVEQFEKLLDDETPGRALDFLTQELAREANTIASKSADVTIAHAVVDLKTLIERLREQVQNIE